MSIVVLLIGVGSTGKSTIARALKSSLPNFEIVGFDYAVEQLDKRYWSGGADGKEVFFCRRNNPRRHCTRFTSWTGAKLLDNLQHDMIQKAISGKDLIIDTVLSDDELHLLLLEKLLPKVYKLCQKLSDYAIK